MHINKPASHVSYKRLCNVLATSIPESLQPVNSHPLQLYPANARKSTVWLPTEFLSICHQWFIYIQLHYTYLISYDTFSPQRSIPYLLNKAPWGGLYTPAAGRIRQTYCHHLYNYETIIITIISRDTLSQQPK